MMLAERNRNLHTCMTRLCIHTHTALTINDKTCEAFIRNLYVLVEQCDVAELLMQRMLNHTTCVLHRPSRRMITCSSHAERSAKMWRLAKTGDLGNLRLVEDTVPAVQHGQVRVAVKAVRLCFLVTQTA